ncbi:nucleopolyhedrovirus P10 family protein [Streptomyces bathyalis]|uniref:Nucleopolyhedrovirus P10 family protein n=1 Tax=Streptomyces bathyalis TaxID=2710756 RepID=A0A7T1TAQ5_9ACTN|nr:nucleopolyhedrovirus P10 family protein [Streptomyces bathyalis]QPP09517.1 nucleopolyhedrovirus P10 family protein [Streptomyces bathyalis]
MDAEGLSHAVRQQLGLGRLLPLGDAADGAWLAESTAEAALRRTAGQALPDARLGGLRIRLADPRDTSEPAVPAPPSALPPGPLHIDADFASPPHAPLTTMAELLRAALLTAADRELGLRVVTVDLRVTDLLVSGNGHNGEGTFDRSGETPGGAGGAGAQRQGKDTGERRSHGSRRHPPAPADDPRGAATAQAVISVPGVTRLAPVLGSTPGGPPADAVNVMNVTDRDGRAAGRHLRIQFAVAEGSRALDVARAVRHTAAKAAAWDAEEPDLPVTVAVLVSAIDPAGT